MMKQSNFRRVLGAFLALAVTVLLSPQGNADYRYYYSFTDRHGAAIAALEEAFAVRVVSFTPGDPWTDREANQKPEIALGLPDAKNDTGDLNLGGGGVLVAELGLPVYDGPGYDLFVFEAGGSVEEMRAEVSDDLATWYDVGTLSGSTAEADLEGKTPEGASFRYVRLTDAGKNNSGSWPGADIDALCALNAVTGDDAPAVYRFKDRQGAYRGALATSFASRVVSFTPGDPWTSHAESQSPEIALGLPDYSEAGGGSTGDLNLGAGGSVVLEFDAPLWDGPGADLYIFEAGSGGAEETKAEVSDDLQSWLDVGSISGSKLWIDMAGAAPEGQTFRYLRLTDLSMSGGGWPGADIDAACNLHMTPELFHFADKNGVPYSVPADAFASRVVDFVPGDPWTSRANDRKVENALGIPDYDNDDGELTLGGGGVVTLAFDAELYDGPGLDIFVFEIADQVESARIEVSRDLETWYDVGVSEGSFAGVDIAGKVPDGFGFFYVRLTDLRDHPSGTWPGADIDAVCGFHMRDKSAVSCPYRINSLLIQSDTFRIAEGELTAAVSVTKTGRSDEAFACLAAYDANGKMLGSVSLSEIGDRALGETFELTFPVDNRAGTVSELRAFVVGPSDAMAPLSYPFAYAAKE